MVPSGIPTVVPGTYESTVVITITSCEGNKCEPVPVTSVQKTIVTETITGVAPATTQTATEGAKASPIATEASPIPTKAYTPIEASASIQFAAPVPAPASTPVASKAYPATVAGQSTAIESGASSSPIETVAAPSISEQTGAAGKAVLSSGAFLVGVAAMLL